MYTNTILPVEASSCVQTSSDFEPDAYVYNILGKRCSTLNHGAFDMSTTHNNNAPWQTLALHVNTRHIVQHYPAVAHSMLLLPSTQVSSACW